MIDLKSHPNIELREHITQVSVAADYLCKQHSANVISPHIKNLIQKAILLHDAGKATKKFQEYINNPDAYTGDPMEKSHTPMSTLLSILLSIEENWDALETMMVSASVFGHHGALPTTEKLREIGRGKIAKTLKKQIPSLQLEGIKQHCGVDVSTLQLDNRPWAVAKEHLDDHIFPIFNSLSIEEGAIFRLKTQLLFSILLEADKAFLAVKEPQKYIELKRKQWMAEWVDKKIGRPEETPINKIRQSIRSDIKKKIEEIEENGIFSLTSPTGSGKTLLAATWLLKLREKRCKKGICPRIIIVLPFLSVIDQTVKEYESLLRKGGQKSDGSWLLQSHSLSDRKYKEGLEGESEHFFVDTWRTEVVITTYDQFLMVLMDPKARYQMRFHNLCDSLIVMDEVQSLPHRLWKPLEKILKTLVKIGNSSILLMSATLPSIIPDAKPLVENYSDYFKSFNRYRIEFRLDEKMTIDDFCDIVFSRRDEWLKKGKRVLITLNTRRSARYVRDKLEKEWPKDYSEIPLLFISADVTPKDRMKKIEIIKKKKPCIVVSTQCVEAGVDIDMDYVIRDFAPFDSIIQIAGRCNRNGKKEQNGKKKQGTVEIVDITDEKGRRYSDMIYDDIHLQVTRQVIENKTEMEEKDILALANRYFDMLEGRKDTGKKHLENFVRWQEGTSVRELLRGKEREKYTFLVLTQDPELKEKMKEANDIENRWERREAWRAIAGRIANISVSVYAKPGFRPETIAEEYLGQWILREGFYSSERGLDLYDNVSYEFID